MIFCIVLGLFQEKLSTKDAFKPTNETLGFTKLLHALYGSSSKSCAFAYADCDVDNAIPPEDDVNVLHEEQVMTSAACPRPLSEILQSKAINSHKDIDALSVDEIEALNQATVDQSKSSLWHNHRIYRITSSTMYRVHTKMLSVQANRKADTQHIVRVISGNTTPFLNNDMKYGQTLEPEAKKCLEKKLKKDGHRDVSVRQCGIIVHQKYPFIAGSPDGVVDCSCCASRPIEVKCPSTLAGLDPSVNLHSCL